MEITSGMIGVGATVAGVAFTIAGAAVRGAFASRDEKITVNTAAWEVLGDKLDRMTSSHQDYRLYVAENYVNQNVLEKQLAPILNSLEKLRTDLEAERRK